MIRSLTFAVGAGTLAGIVGFGLLVSHASPPGAPQGRDVRIASTRRGGEMTPANDNGTDTAWARYCAAVQRLRLARLLNGRG